MKIFDRNTLVDFREALGVDIPTLARVSGLSKATIENLENGQVTRPQTNTILRLAHALSIPPFFLYNEEQYCEQNPSVAIIERRLKILTRLVRMGVKDLDKDLANLSLELSKLIFEVDNVRLDYIRQQSILSRKVYLQ